MQSLRNVDHMVLNIEKVTVVDIMSGALLSPLNLNRAEEEPLR